MLVEARAAKGAAVIQREALGADPVVIDASEYLQVLELVEADAAVEELFEILQRLLHRFLLCRVLYSKCTWSQNVTHALLVEIQ